MLIDGEGEYIVKAMLDSQMDTIDLNTLSSGRTMMMVTIAGRCRDISTPR
jgi:hypothetical protein